MSELKPCPFCGGEVSIAETGDAITRWFFITRGNSETNRNCKCRVFMDSIEFEPYSDFSMKIAKEMLIEAWNRRVKLVEIDQFNRVGFDTVKEGSDACNND